MSDTVTVTETVYNITVTEGATQTVTVSPTEPTITITEPAATNTTVTTPASQIVTITQSASVGANLGASTTDDLAEGTTNLYFTNARASAAAPVQSVTMPTGYTVADTDGDLVVTVTNATSVRQGIGAHDAGNLSTGDLNAARVAQINITAFNDVANTLDKTAQNILYTNGTLVAARAPSNWSLDDFTFDATFSPSTDATYDIGTPDARVAQVHGDLDGAVVFLAKNTSGGTLSVGDIVFISGATGDEKANVQLADADDAAKMPAFGMISTGGGNNNDVYVTTLGTVTGVDLPSGTYSVGDEVYVSTTAGEFTLTPPTGETGLIQKIGKVMRVNPGSSPNTGTLKIMGAGRTNAVPNLDQDKVFLGNGSNQAASTALSAINLSKFNNDLSLADDDWKYTPKNTVITRVFDDMLGVVGRNSRMNGPFFGMGTSSSFWQDSFGDTPASGETGVARAYLNANAYARCVITGHQIYAANAPVGTEWLYEGRFYFDFNSNAANDPSVAFGAYCPKTEHSDSTTEGGFGYGDTSKAGVYWKKNNTYWKSYAYDVEGTNGGTVETDLTPFTPAEDTWVRVAVHCKRETVFSVDVWTIKVYIDGTLATTQYLSSGTEAPTFYSAIYNSGTAYQNNMYVDWLMFQFTRPDSVSYLDIEDL